MKTNLDTYKKKWDKWDQKRGISIRLAHGSTL